MPRSNKLRIYILVFLVSFSILIGSSYNTYLSYERFYNPDSETYTNTARFNFEDQSLVRKYRIIVPFLANITTWPIGKLYYKIFKDKRDVHDWPLLTGFFIVNAFLMSLSAVFIFAIMRHKRISMAGCVIGISAFLTGGRWASFLTGHPVTDSLTILCIAMVIYGLIRPKYTILYFGIIIGLLSKESVLLFYPMILLFSTGNRLKVLASMLGALSLYFLLKYGIDQLSGTDLTASLQQDLDHTANIELSLRKLFSPKGVGDLFSVYGFFCLPLLTGIFYKSFRDKISVYFDKLFLVFLLTIIVHMLLSTELARMFYLGSAIFIPLLAKSFEIHPAVIKILQPSQVDVDTNASNEDLK